jgi:hypothetical protein
VGMVKLISFEESKKYIPCNEDFLGGFEKVAYYTLIPLEDSWEKVMYFTARQKNIYSNREGNFDSWVYILSNPTTPDMFKIGYTKLDPNERAKQLSSSTGVVLPYKVEWAFHCFNGEQLEQEVHKALDFYRVNSHREFFQISLDEAKRVVENLGSRYI